MADWRQLFAFQLLQSLAQVLEKSRWDSKIVSASKTTQRKSLKNELTYFSTVAMLNYLPIIGQAAQLAAEVLYSSASDYFGKRLPFLLVHSVCFIPVTIDELSLSDTSSRLSILRLCLS
jgi:hypothetical protein